MNRKQLTILVVACAVLGVVGWVVYNKRNSGDSDSVEGGGRDPATEPQRRAEGTEEEPVDDEHAQ